jgi:outer membrane protein TolC
VNLVGQYGLFSDHNNFSEFFRRFERHNATFGVSILVPVYERERFRARLSKAGAELAEARLRRDEARATIAQQVRMFWGTTEEQGGAREVARLELELARRSLEAVLAQYEEGRASRLAVEQARIEEDRAWVGLFNAEYEAEKAQLELLRLTGEIRAAFQ